MYSTVVYPFNNNYSVPYLHVYVLTHTATMCYVLCAMYLEFTNPMFAFIEEAIAGGESVLVHCLAGAHRAGTTGCACLVHFAGLHFVLFYPFTVNIIIQMYCKLL